jgi:hypothetical protein
MKGMSRLEILTRANAPQATLALDGRIPRV